MRNGLIHIHVLQVLLLVADDDVDVVLAPQAVVGNRQQRIDVGRQVNSHNSGALVEGDVQKTRILVGKTVVVLPPDGGRDQDIQGSDLVAPRKMVANGQPLGMLVEHRVDDVDKGFIGRNKAVAAGEQVAF